MKKILLGSLGLFLSLGATQHAFAAAAAEDVNNQDDQWLGKQLIRAVESNDMLEVQKLINQGAPVNFQSTEKRTLDMTPLMVAREQGYNNIAQTLICAGANSNTRSRYNNTSFTIPKHMAHVIQQALQSPKRKQKLGEQLLRAVSEDNIPTVKKLINSNAPINFILIQYGPNKSFLTPLMLACQKSSYNIVTLLLDKKANPNIKDATYDQTALTFNLENNPDSNIIKALLEANAQVNGYNFMETTPLMYASCENMLHKPLSPEIIYLLVNAKADLTARDNDGNNALMKAIGEGKHGTAVRALVFAGTPLYMSNNNKNNAWNIPLSGGHLVDHLEMMTRKQMNKLLQQAINEKTSQLSKQLYQHSPLAHVAINIIIDYVENDYSAPDKDDGAAVQS